MTAPTLTTTTEIVPLLCRWCEKPWDALKVSGFTVTATTWTWWKCEKCGLCNNVKRT